MERDAHRHFPSWTVRDLEAVKVLLAAPAPTEQIALARIEGLSATRGYELEPKLTRIHMIARRGLGLV